MLTKSFDDMCDSAARYVEKEVDANGFLTDTEVSEYVNRGIADIWDDLVQAMGVEWFSKLGSVAVTSGTSSYALESDFGYLIHPWITVNGQTHDIDKWDLPEEPFLRNITQDIANVKYRVTGSTVSTSAAATVELLPVPRQSFTFNYRYVFAPPVLSYGGGDTFSAHPAAIEYAELIAAIKVATKEQIDFTGLMADAQRVKKRLRVMASARDHGRPMKIHDTRRDGGDKHFRPWKL